ncbi:hypothetical protein HMPREF2758_06875 [Facklamia sp. HMSC062C11]|uniref:glycosyltransferase n=1 Tax=Facklamia sp. HMSC062C11 TaxID=1739262 RepID=UPI0008A58C3B|nr:glycosyltransferase [Facklamia sp. HMSC062C11]OFL66860.1 hypothetical protein HMPREF2758_06875 [Facklamia sp. HMSC062C11]
MRVVLLRSNPVNPDSRVEKEVNSLVGAGYQVQILAWDRENHRDSLSNLDLKNGIVPIHRFGIQANFGGGFKKNSIPLIKFQMRLFSWLTCHKNEYDIIHACDFDTSLTGLLISKLYSKKLVYDIFDYYVDSFNVPNLLKAFIEKLDRMVINRADAVILCSEKRKEQILGTKPKYLEIIHNTPDIRNIENELISLDRVSSSKVSICYVGILQEGRLLIELGRCVSKLDNVELHIGGFGQLEDYFFQLSQSSDNVYFYGKLPYEEVLKLEASCDVLTAIYDNSIKNHKYAAPNKFYEGLLLGKPIIMARNTGMDNYIASFGNGWIIDFNEESLFALLSKISKDSLAFEKANDYKLKMLFEWRKMEMKLIKLYGRL